MTLPIRQIAERLAQNAEAVCRHYLDNGRKSGRHWIVGDAYNTKGRSMFVRLAGPTYGPGAAGKWTDAASGEHGDLLDIIALTLNISLSEAREEALRFLSLPSTARKPEHQPVARNSSQAARRLFAASMPITYTPGETYLRRTRGITCSLVVPALRFHPRCYHLTDTGRMELPAIIAAITDNAGDITGVQRLYLAPDGLHKAAIEEPRRSLGDLLGNAIRIGAVTDVLAAGDAVHPLPASPHAGCRLRVGQPPWPLHPAARLEAPLHRSRPRPRRSCSGRAAASGRHSGRRCCRVADTARQGRLERRPPRRCG
jgi:hypothetical protein